MSQVFISFNNSHFNHNSSQSCLFKNNEMPGAQEQLITMETARRHAPQALPKYAAA
jgi:hypothetical protein